MATAPTIPAVGTPRLDIAVDKTDLSPDARGDIVSVELRDEVDLPAMLALTLSLWDRTRQRLKDAYFEQFQLGTSVEVSLGLDRTLPIFAGEVAGLEPSFGGDTEGETLQVQAYNRLHRLRFGTHQRTFKDMTDSDIASSIADEVGLKADVEKTAVKYPHITQNNVNNLIFLLERARQNNYEVAVEDETLRFRKTRATEGPEMKLAYRRDLIHFIPRLRAVPEGGKVEVRGWDVKAKKPIIGTAGSGDEASKMGGAKSGAELSAAAFAPSTRTITDRAVADADEAQQIAKACYNRQQRDFVEADGECLGIPELRAGKTVEIAGIGNPFSGIYYVVSSTHSLGSDGYRTRFKVRRIAV